MDIFSNTLVHTKLISAMQVKAQHELSASMQYNSKLSKYIEYFNANYIFDISTSVVKCVYSSTQFPDFQNETFWLDLYSIFINAGYTGVRLTQNTDMFYIVEADILTSTEGNSQWKYTGKMPRVTF